MDLDKVISNHDRRQIYEINLDTKDKEQIIDIDAIHENHRFFFYYTAESRKGKSINYIMFNDKFEKEWNNNNLAETESGYISQYGYHIDKVGNVYALQKIYNNKKGNDFNQEMTKIWLACYPKTGEAPISIPLLLREDGYIKEAVIGINSNHDVVCAGFYASNKTKMTEGNFCFIVSPLLSKIKVETSKAFSDEDKKRIKEDLVENSDLQSGKSIFNKERELPLYIKDITFQKDSGFSIIGQGRFTVHKTSNYSTSVEQTFTSFLMADFDETGSTTQQKVIPNKVVVVNNIEDLGGFFYWYDHKKLMILTAGIENPKDIMFYRTNIYLITLDEHGDITKTKLSDKITANSIFPGYSFKEDNGKIVVFRSMLYEKFSLSNKYKRIRFGELRFE